MTSKAAERDPAGLDLNTPGAKADGDKHRPHLVFAGFARALEQVSEVGTAGARKYSDYGHYKVPNGVERYTNAMQRHYLEECKGGVVDPTSGFLHAAHTAWNALARLELMLTLLEQAGLPIPTLASQPEPPPKPTQPLPPLMPVECVTGSKPIFAWVPGAKEKP